MNIKSPISGVVKSVLRKDSKLIVVIHSSLFNSRYQYSPIYGIVRSATKGVDVGEIHSVIDSPIGDVKITRKPRGVSKRIDCLLRKGSFINTSQKISKSRTGCSVELVIPKANVVESDDLAEGLRVVGGISNLASFEL